MTADFAGGLISSDGGLVLLREAERRLGLAEALAGCIREWRDPERVVHTLPAMLRFRMFAIACGYEDADDCDALRDDPLFKLAVGRAPESGRDLCSQPTMSRLENAPSRVEVARMTAALVDVFCRSFPAPPAAITLDIDDTCDPVHGRQQLSLFNAHYDTRCFLPVHVYHVESGKPVAVLLRPGKTPSGAEIRTLLKHLVRRIRRHWPRTRLTFRGDSHYGRAEAMAWCEDTPSGASWSGWSRSARVCASGPLATQSRYALSPVALPGPADRRSKSPADQPVGERAVALTAMILQPGGVRRIGAKKPDANFVVLPADHAPEPGKETFHQIGVDAVAAVGVGMVDAVNIELRLEKVPMGDLVGRDRRSRCDPLPGEAHTIGRPMLIAHELERRVLVPLFDRQQEAPERCSLITTAASRQRPELRAFRDWILREAAPPTPAAPGFPRYP